MIYLLLILFPVSMAATMFVLRKRTELVIVASVFVVLTQMILVVQLPVDTPVRLLGVRLALNGLSQLFLLVFLVMSALSFLASWNLPHGENFIPVVLLTLSLVCATLLLQDHFLVSLLLIGAGIVAVLAIVDMPTGAGMLVEARALASALKYLVLMVIAGVFIYLSFILNDIYQPGEFPGRISLARFILALLVGGFALRLALIPFHTWLPDLVEHAAPLVSVLVIAIINTTSLLVLVLTFQRSPVLLAENPTGLTFLRMGGLVSCLLGSGLAIGQTSMRRTLAYLLIYDSSMVFYGLASVSFLGLTGAMFTSLNTVLVVTLIFISLGMLEQPDGRPSNIERRDLLRRWPVAGLGLLGGGLALLGLPPFSGFASKMLLYHAAAAYSWYEMAALVVATALAGLALARLARDKLFGPGEHMPTPEPLMLGEMEEFDRPPPRRLEPEAWSTALLAVVLLAVCLGVGLYPQPLITLISDAIRELVFV